MPPDGAPEEVRIPLRTTGYRFSPGHRIRLTILTSYWPVLWPSPSEGELRLHRGGVDASRLVLPVLGAAAVDLPVPAFRTEPVVMRDVGGSEEDEPEWRIEEDVLRGTVTRDDLRGRREHPGGRLAPVQQRTPGPDRLGPRPGARLARQRRRLPLDGLRRRRGHPGDGAGSNRTRRRSTSASRSTCAWTASRSSPASGRSGSRAAWSRTRAASPAARRCCRPTRAGPCCA